MSENKQLLPLWVWAIILVIAIVWAAYKVF
jgi:hypothetical protein